MSEKEKKLTISLLWFHGLSGIITIGLLLAGQILISIILMAIWFIVGIIPTILTLDNDDLEKYYNK